MADPFELADIAHRVAGIRTAYIKKENGKYCVKSEKNSDWSGGCYDTKEEAEKRLGQVEMMKSINS